MWLHQPVPSWKTFPSPDMGCRGSRQGEEESAAMVWDEELWDGMASVRPEGQKPTQGPWRTEGGEVQRLVGRGRA